MRRYKPINYKQISKTEWLGYSVIAILFLAFYFLFFSQMPIGDDVLGMFKNSIFNYLDEFKDDFSISSGKMTSLNDMLQKIGQEYMLWHARVIPKLFYYFLMISSPTFSSLLNAIVMVMIILIAASIVCDCKFKEVFQHPLTVAYLGIAGIWYGQAIAYIRMNMFVSMYALPTLFFLIYYKMHMNLVKSDYQTGKTGTLLLTIIGFCAGSMNEVLSLYLIIWISFEIIILFFQKKISIIKIFIHTGYLIGYLTCVLAPGNFNRMWESHESRMFNSFSEKISESIRSHYYVIRGNGMWISYTLCFIAVLLAGYVLISRIRYFGVKQAFSELFSMVGSYAFIFAVSIFIWGIFGHMPEYAQLFPRLIFYIAVALYVHNNSPSNKIRKHLVSICTAVLVIGFIVLNTPWLMHETHITMNRRKLINVAQSSNQEMVVVPPYNETGEFSFFGYTNNHINNFDEDYYIEYYGVRVVVDR